MQVIVAHGLWFYCDNFCPKREKGLGPITHMSADIETKVARMHKLAVEAHNGKIWITDGAEGGAAIHFTLPKEIPDQDGEGTDTK